ncbi:unnamed protein product [Gemmata massiliana]|uniref:Knr4/Smi1-like domain-containing protein n=1 Tax=Gemmata massiliana TaxID=1210884 RepID=A0A6P2CYJ6_9BACT|nr:SMI1/KNR4 family protein [Gemmata massiliana]VTR93185.1 unnamed protein product [Gemmata massiliana]
MIPNLVRRRKVARAELDRTEAALELSLPDDYKRFLLEHGCGRPVPEWYRVPARLLRRIKHSVGEYMPMTSLDRPRATFTDPRSGDTFVVVARSGNELVLLSTGAGGVQYWPELGSDFETALEGKDIGRIADTFADFSEEFEYPSDTLPWLRYVHENDLAGLVAWLDGRGKANARSRYANAPIVEAIAHRRQQMVAELKQRGAKVDSRAIEIAKQYKIDL